MEREKEFREYTRQLERKLEFIRKAECCCCEVNTTQCFMIVEIGRKPGISVKELAQKLDVDKSVISRALEDLVQKEYVVRNVSDSDRRFVTITLAERGIRRFEMIEKDMNDKFEELLQEVPEGKQEMLIEALRIYVEACARVEEKNAKENR